MPHTLSLPICSAYRPSITLDSRSDNVFRSIRKGSTRRCNDALEEVVLTSATHKKSPSDSMAGSQPTPRLVRCLSRLMFDPFEVSFEEVCARVRESELLFREVDEKGDLLR